jgi:hypothetical protein
LMGLAKSGDSLAEFDFEDTGRSKALAHC